jgi:hypothetical protein
MVISGNIPIHGKIVVHSMHEEMKGKERRFVRKILVKVEQEPMKCVFQDGPDHVSEQEAAECLKPRFRWQG